MKHVYELMALPTGIGRLSFAPKNMKEWRFLEGEVGKLHTVVVNGQETRIFSFHIDSSGNCRHVVVNGDLSAVDLSDERILFPAICAELSQLDEGQSFTVDCPKVVAHRVRSRFQLDAVGVSIRQTASGFVFLRGRRKTSSEQLRQAMRDAVNDGSAEITFKDDAHLVTLRSMISRMAGTGEFIGQRFHTQTSGSRLIIYAQSDAVTVTASRICRIIRDIDRHGVSLDDASEYADMVRNFIEARINRPNRDTVNELI